MLRKYEILKVLDESLGLNNMKHNCSYTFYMCEKVFSELAKRNIVGVEDKIYLYLDDKLLEINIGILSYDESWNWDFHEGIIKISYDEYKNYKRTKLIDKILC